MSDRALLRIDLDSNVFQYQALIQVCSSEILLMRQQSSYGYLKLVNPVRT